MKINPCMKCGEMPFAEQVQYWFLIKCGSCDKEVSNDNSFVATLAWNKSNEIGALMNKNKNLVLLRKLEQGSKEWLEERLGNITMSNAKKLITMGKGKTRATYLNELASELSTGVLSDNISTYDMLRGNVLEDYARRAYERITGLTVESVGLGYLDASKRISASPDGLIYKNGELVKGIEIKCQKPKNHLETILTRNNPKQFAAQMQGCMWIFGVDSWDYVSYCPEFGGSSTVIITIERDEDMISHIAESALRAVSEVDEIVKTVKDISNDTANINSSALEALSMILGTDEVEII